jgi:cell division protein FtsB
MTPKKRYDDADLDIIPLRENGNSAIKSILVAVICAFIVGIGGYIFYRGLNTNVAVANVEKDVAVVKNEVLVLKQNHDAMKQDIKDIKNLTIEIRLDQVRRQKLGK